MARVLSEGAERVELCLHGCAWGLLQYPNYVMHHVNLTHIFLTTEQRLYIMTQNLV